MNPFSPNWVSPPGNTIQDILIEKRWTTEDFRKRMRMSKQEVDDLIEGRKQITPRIAANLSKTVGSTVEFWLKREEDYRNQKRDLDKL